MIILPNLISEIQCAFMSYRLITDNVCIAFEVMNYIIQNKWGKVGEMALKLDSILLPIRE